MIVIISSKASSIFITRKKIIMEISVGHTPDSDDAFIVMECLQIPSPEFKVNHVIEDIEKLNQKATDPELDVTAVSVHACAYIPGYTILRWRSEYAGNPCLHMQKQSCMYQINHLKNLTSMNLVLSCKFA